MKRTTEKNLMVFSGRANPELAQAVAEGLGTQLVPTEHRTFASGEILTRFEVSIRGCDFFLIQSFGPPVNEWLKQQNEGQMCGWQANAAPAAK